MKILLAIVLGICVFLTSAIPSYAQKSCNCAITVGQCSAGAKIVQQSFRPEDPVAGRPSELHWTTQLTRVPATGCASIQFGVRPSGANATQEIMGVGIYIRETWEGQLTISDLQRTTNPSQRASVEGLYLRCRLCQVIQPENDENTEKNDTKLTNDGYVARESSENKGGVENNAEKEPDVFNAALNDALKKSDVVRDAHDSALDQGKATEAFMAFEKDASEISRHYAEQYKKMYMAALKDLHRQMMERRKGTDTRSAGNRLGGAGGDPNGNAQSARNCEALRQQIAAYDSAIQRTNPKYSRQHRLAYENALRGRAANAAEYRSRCGGSAGTPPRPSNAPNLVRKNNIPYSDWKKRPDPSPVESQGNVCDEGMASYGRDGTCN